MKNSFKLISSNEDLQKVIELDKSHFPWPWNEAFWPKFYQRPESVIICSYKDNEIIAFCALEAIDSESRFHLHKIYVKDEYQGSGLARDLWSFCGEKFPPFEIYLEVATSNLRAVKFYEARGLKSIRKVDRFYADGQGAYIMTNYD